MRAWTLTAVTLAATLACGAEREPLAPTCSREDLPQGAVIRCDDGVAVLVPRDDDGSLMRAWCSWSMVEVLP